MYNILIVVFILLSFCENYMKLYIYIYKNICIVFNIYKSIIELLLLLFRERKVVNDGFLCY